MKDVPIEELAAISVEIYEAAMHVGCTHVSITGRIWPGGRTSGLPEEAARFTEYSWLKAAVVNGQAIFEETDPKSYAALLTRYGLGDEPYFEPEPPGSETILPPAVSTPTQSGRAEITMQLLPATRRELERQAAAESLSVGEFLDWKFQPLAGR